MHDLRAVLLCHAVVKAQGYHLPLALRQRLYRSAQRNIFNKLVLRAVVAEDKLKEAVLPRLALDTVGRPSRRRQAMSSGAMPVSRESSDIVGSRPMRCSSFIRA